MSPLARSTSLLALGALLTMSMGAGLVPYGGMAGLPLGLVGCALAAPMILTFSGRTWLGWSCRELGLAWACWLGFYPASVLVAVLSQPWDVAP